MADINDGQIFDPNNVPELDARYLARDMMLIIGELESDVQKTGNIRNEGRFIELVNKANTLMVMLGVEYSGHFPDDRVQAFSKIKRELIPLLRNQGIYKVGYTEPVLKVW